MRNFVINFSIHVLILVVPNNISYANENCKFGNGEYKFVDVLPCLSAKTDTTIIASKVAMKTFSLNQNTLKVRGFVTYIKDKMQKNQITWLEHEGIVNIIKKDQLEQRAIEIKSLHKSQACHANNSLLKTKMEFAEPTDIKKISKHFSKLYRTVTIVDKNVSGKLQIHNNRKVSVTKACTIWLRSLNQINLAAVSRNGINVLLPMRIENRWQWPTSMVKNTRTEQVSFDFSELTEVRNIISRYQEVMKADLVLVDNPTGDIAIYSPGKIESSRLPFLFSTTLRLAGFEMKDGKITSL